MLHQDLEGPVDSIRAQQPRWLPTFLTKDDMRRMLSDLSGTHRPVAQLVYGSGLRLMDAKQSRKPAQKDRKFEMEASPNGGDKAVDSGPALVQGYRFDTCTCVHVSL